MTMIRYIGLKPVKEDNVAGTGLIWAGPGDVHDVADPAAAAKLLSFRTVWDEPPAEADAGKTTVQQVAELDALRGAARALGVDVKGTWGAAKLTKAIADAEAALAKTAEADAGKTTVQQVAELDALRGAARALGVDVKGTWGAAKLTKAIADAEAALAKTAEADAGKTD